MGKARSRSRLQGTVRRYDAGTERRESRVTRRRLTTSKGSRAMAARHKSVETKYMEEREGAARTAAARSPHLPEGRWRERRRRDGQGSDAAAYLSARQRRRRRVDKNASATGAPGTPPFTFAYISDTHLYERTLNQRFVRRGQGGRGRQRARSAARLRAVRRRPGAAGTARGAGARQGRALDAQGAGQDDGRRARLVLRHGRDLAGAVRPAQLLVRLEGRPRHRADERA